MFSIRRSVYYKLCALYYNMLEVTGLIIMFLMYTEQKLYASPLHLEVAWFRRFPRLPILDLDFART